jgi:hypothetical protein
METSTTYIIVLGNPDMTLTGAGSVSGDLDSIPSSDSSTFAKGKTASTTSNLDEICDTIEPFLDCEGQGNARQQPKSFQEESKILVKDASKFL